MLNQTTGEFGHPTFTNGPGRLPVSQPQVGGNLEGTVQFRSMQETHDGALASRRMGAFFWRVGA